MRATKVKSERHRRHRKERDKDRDKDKKHHFQPVGAAPLLSDARAECILVASRRIGRIRAGVISGFVKERAGLEREADSLAQNAQNNADPEQHNTHHVMLSPQSTHPPSAILVGAVDPDDHIIREDAGSSSPPIPLAVAYANHASSSRAGPPNASQRRLAPSPFTPPGSTLPIPRQPQMPTHLHPSVQAYTTVQQGRHPHAMPHPGYAYFAPGTAQSGSVPFFVPMPWAVPGTPPGAPATQARPPQRETRENTQVTGQRPSKTRTPARGRTATGAGESNAATPMDSLVSAARTLIEDEDYDGDGDRVDAGGAETETAEDEVVEETPVRRRGSRRRAAAAAPDSPVSKRRRVGGPANSLPAAAAAVASGAASATPPGTTRAARRGKAAASAAAPPPAQEKPKAKGRARGKGKEKASVPVHGIDSTPPVAASTSAIAAAVSARAPPRTAAGRTAHAPKAITRIRSALDVLADQAAQEQERRPSLDPASRRASESEGGREEPGPGHETETEAEVEVEEGRRTHMLVPPLPAEGGAGELLMTVDMPAPPPDDLEGSWGGDDSAHAGMDIDSGPRSRAASPRAAPSLFPAVEEGPPPPSSPGRRRSTSASCPGPERPLSPQTDDPVDTEVQPDVPPQDAPHLHAEHEPPPSTLPPPSTATSEPQPRGKVAAAQDPLPDTPPRAEVPPPDPVYPPSADGASILKDTDTVVDPQPPATDPQPHVAPPPPAASAAVEIESGDEDAEGSIVEEAD
ncbi:hypothetical protein BD413DRAFT_524728 [Trametes elegans]|nr:hypothetical protein BD413DRAFT_524728 [Trametes elegans]